MKIYTMIIIGLMGTMVIYAQPEQRKAVLIELIIIAPIFGKVLGFW